MSQIYLLLINKERRLSNEALAKIADISEGIGHISFGSIALQFLVDNQSAGFLI